MLLFLGSLSASHAETAPSFRWGQVFPAESGVFPWALAVDDLGTSYFSGRIDQGGLTIGTNVLSADGGHAGAIFIGACDHAGTVLWAKRDGSPFAAPYGMAFDPDGNIRVLCYLGVQISNPLAGTNVSGSFALATYQKDGQGLGAVLLATTNLWLDGLAIDPAGNSYWTGDLYGGGYLGNTNLPGPGALLGKCDRAGNVAWVKVAQSSSVGGVSLYPPRLDLAGNVYVSGHIREPVAFQGTNLTPVGISDMVLAKYTREGDLLWIKQSGGPGLDTATSPPAIDPLGNCFIGGSFFQAATFGGIVLSNSTPTQYLCAVKFAPDGNVLWANQVCEASAASRAFTASDDKGNCYLWAGCSNGGMLCAKYDRDGNLSWNKFSSAVSPFVLAADALGHCYLSGKFVYHVQTATFDQIALSTATAEAAFLVKLDTATIPELRLRVVPDSVSVCWPVLADEFHLESTSDLTRPGSWVSNAEVPSVSGQLNIINLPRSADAMFYQLRRD